MVESEGGTEKVYRKLLNEENTRDIARTSEKVEGPRELIRRDDMTKALQMFWKGKEIQWRPWGRPCITWLSTIQQDLRSHNLTLPEAVDMAQNRSLWKMWSTYGATQSWVACQKRRHPNMLYLVVTWYITMMEAKDDYHTWYETVRREMVWCQMLNQANLMSSSRHGSGAWDVIVRVLDHVVLYVVLYVACCLCQVGSVFVGILLFVSTEKLLDRLSQNSVKRWHTSRGRNR